MYASITSAWRSRLKMSVTLMLRPSEIIWRIGAIPAAVAGIFTITFATLEPLVQVPAAASVPGRVVGESGVDLDADVAVDAAGRLVDRVEDVGGAVDVLEHHRPVVVDRRVLVGGELAELVVVVGRAADRLLEDRRVRRQPADPAVAQAGELARREVAALQVVEPGLWSNSSCRRMSRSLFESSIPRCCRDQRLGPLDDVGDVDAEAVEHDVARRAGAEAVDADRVVGETLPAERGGGLDRQHGHAVGEQRHAVGSRPGPRGGPSSAGSRPAPRCRRQRAARPRRSRARPRCRWRR